ncbi:MAG: bifunctional (p)ppGpp synthetase/guanosine-3',5'-bis(diphosphate) 3'-pyrophosphohydrolase [Parasulfuritortus sp.]|jgi:GTP pyrophosphokinase|nr:bifunctional (p)ppGpp synthetase/guanosine-3',5'-bis(diphosphate) 3'-pyrophosphohydrolase [Parasulfuritortus sp.]
MVAHALTQTHDGASGWLAALEQKYSPEHLALLKQAVDWLETHGNGLTADTGAALIDQSLGTAAILAGMQFDAETVAAALICTLPEPSLSSDRIEPALGKPVSHLAQGAARLHQMDRFIAATQPEGQDQSEALRQMLLAMTDDIRVVLIKLADRCQALRELASGDPAMRRKVAQDARDLYAPLANRLGVWQLKWELEDLSCRYLEPDTYKQIARLLDERRMDREWYIEKVIEQVKVELHRDGIATVAVSGRPKHIASILAKMRKKHLDFEEVYDVRAVRVLVKDVKDCYHALGLIHSLWQPIPGQFDDYISRPKGNGYKSLHTAVVGPENKALEIQIRTFDMHQEAELGVAAHWRYKEGGKGHQIADKVAWLRQLLAWKQEVADSAELARQFKNELFQDEVFVLTPQGKVVALAQGATPIDFAYAVHTELGHRCRGAKLDGVLVPLDTPLKTGQRVEILTVKEGGPSRDWMNAHLGFTATSRARSKVRQWFKQLDHDSHVQEGRDILDRELHRLNLNNVNLEQLAVRLKFAKSEELYAALGRGDLGAGQLTRSLQDEFLPPPEKPLVSAPRSRETPSGLLVEGEANLLTHMAGCCKPAPGEAIVGYTTLGRGVTIHRADCPVVQRLPADKRSRLLKAEWGNAGKNVFAVLVEIAAYDRQGLLKDITELFSKEHINVIRVNTLSQNEIARMEFTLEVKDVEQLAKFLAKVAHVRGVFQARRK